MVDDVPRKRLFVVTSRKRRDGRSIRQCETDQGLGVPEKRRSFHVCGLVHGSTWVLQLFWTCFDNLQKLELDIMIRSQI